MKVFSSSSELNFGEFFHLRPARMPHDISKVLKIPPRLTDAIIGHLCGDTASVTACSLTCSAWTPPSQAHLFHDLKIPSSQRAHAIVSLLETSPHLALYPRTLEIHAQAGEDHMETVIPSIAPQLSEVRTLRYCGVQFCDLSDRATSALRSNFPQVRTLVFERCRFNSCDDLVALVLASTRVEKLWLNEAEWVRPVEESSVNPELWGASDTRSPLSCVTMRRVDRGMVECLLSPELRTRLDCMVLSPVNGRQRVDEFSRIFHTGSSSTSGCDSDKVGPFAVVPIPNVNPPLHNLLPANFKLNPTKTRPPPGPPPAFLQTTTYRHLPTGSPLGRPPFGGLKFTPPLGPPPTITETLPLAPPLGPPPRIRPKPLLLATFYIPVASLFSRAVPVRFPSRNQKTLMSLSAASPHLVTPTSMFTRFQANKIVRDWFERLLLKALSTSQFYALLWCVGP
ncbi:hypothetical protein FIBSPDRAFT_1015116 [Athelia psychrophila]|uniref:Uncharacterized protein n=1 Tax=Athelia psychrophila TaxID=1759441 RepID=A0A166LRG2_9AGAM|nr:hypothetical protein FIBSPDRAFT_1015116 [Fibularhizoctonia sp. CBS 109695]